ncbi:MAG: hypothetical protein CM15mP23_10250 [Cryomorphaceae bacterium]|nr:MAG: hypothetical protein CM15mP23_10250 [Cryomorphaceae bacterium]
MIIMLSMVLVSLIKVTVNNEINSQEIELVQGWSIFSTYIQPNDPDIISVFNPIAENVIY